MKIGNLDLGKKLLVAPMAEVSDAPFRKIAKEFGAGLTFTQMVSAQGVALNNFKTLRFLSYGRDEKPIGVQILGSDTGWIGQAVREISKFNPDLIDINCGCPIPKVLSKKMGAGILDDPVLLGRIVKAMVDASDGIPVSAKLRLGADKKRINVLDNAKIAEDNGASVVFVHARTKTDKYSADCDWEWIARVKQSLSIPVIGNGSVFTPADAKCMIDSTGCDSVLVARGALGNPFLFERFNAIMETGEDPGQPDIYKVRDAAVKHVRMMEKEFGDIVALNGAKKHIIWYFRYYRGITSLLNDIFAIKSIGELTDFIYNHSEKVKEEFFPDEDFSGIEFKFKDRVVFWIQEQDFEREII